MFRLPQWFRSASGAFRRRALFSQRLRVELLGGDCPLTGAGHRRPASCRPQLEPLEQRVVLSHTRPAAIEYNGWLHVFSTGDDGHLYDHRTQDNVNWFWDDRGFAGGGFYGDPAVTTASTEGHNRLHVYLTAFNGHLYDCWFDDGWHLDDHGNGGSNSRLGDPGVMTYWDVATQRIHVFAAGWANSSWHVYDNWWDGSHWHWDDHRAASGWNFSTPAATAYWNGSVIQIHAFVTDVYGNLYDLYTNDDGATWSFDNHHNSGALLTSGPGVVTYGNQLHIFVPARDHLFDHWWDGNWHWKDLGSTGNGELSTPAVTTYWNGDVKQIHAFVTGDGDLFDAYTNDGGQNWSFDNHGHGNSYVNYNPGVAIDPSNRLHVFVHGNDGHEYDHWWDGDWHWDDRGMPNNGYGPGGAAPSSPAIPKRMDLSPLPLERQATGFLFAAPTRPQRLAEPLRALTVQELDQLAENLMHHGEKSAYKDFFDARPAWGSELSLTNRVINST
jgi:hypothetical protein